MAISCTTIRPIEASDNTMRLSFSLQEQYGLTLSVFDKLRQSRCRMVLSKSEEDDLRHYIASAVCRPRTSRSIRRAPRAFIERESGMKTDRQIFCRSVMHYVYGQPRQKPKDAVGSAYSLCSLLEWNKLRKVRRQCSSRKQPVTESKKMFAAFGRQEQSRHTTQISTCVKRFEKLPNVGDLPTRFCHHRIFASPTEF